MLLPRLEDGMPYTRDEDKKDDRLHDIKSPTGARPNMNISPSSVMEEWK